MNILFISPSFYPATFYGGPSESVYHLSKFLVKQINTLFVVTTDANGKEQLNVTKNKNIELEKNLFVKYYGNSTSYGLSFRMVFNLWKDIKENEIIYIVSIFSPSTPEAIIFSWLFNKIIILSPRGQLSNWAVESKKSTLKKLWFSILIKPFLVKINWHATSVSEANDIKSIFNTEKVFVIPNGLNITEFSTSNNNSNFFQKYLAAPENYLIISSMGRIHRVKGFDILINAVDILLKRGKKVALFIAGSDNGDLKRLNEIVIKKNLQNNIYFVGQLSGETKLNFLSNSNIFALASHSENFGLVYAEALACGTPIIASKNTPWHVVEQSKCGKWIENKSENFANAIETLSFEINDNTKLRCKKFIEDNYSWNNIAIKMKLKLENILYG